MKILSVLLIFGLAIMAVNAYAEFEDFEDPVNPGVWTLLGTAFVSNGILVLTNDAASQAGAIYLNDEFNPIDQIQASFDLMIQSLSVGADGCMFAISSSIEIGGNGGQMGWQGPGIYGIEFDTYHNGWDPIPDRHIALVETTTENHLAWSAFDFQTNVWYHVEITVDNGQFIVMMDNVEYLNYNHAGYEGNQPAFIGVSAGTGAVYDSYTLDNLEINVEQGPIDLNLVGVNTTIPPQGGTLVFDVFVTSEYPQVVEADAWTAIGFPNGQVFGPMIRVTFNLPPGTMSFTGVTQNIPFNAPTGTFTYQAYIGRFPNQIADSDVIVFQKTGVAVNGINNWFGSDWVADQNPSEAAELLSSFAMGRAYPNPFNAATNVSVTLPEAGELTLTVFNVTGQQVAELAHGNFNAGMHPFSFDASGLASGLYFIHARVPGRLDEIQKITLMK